MLESLVRISARPHIGVVRCVRTHVQVLNTYLAEVLPCDLLEHFLRLLLECEPLVDAVVATELADCTEVVFELSRRAFEVRSPVPVEADSVSELE